MSVLLDLYRENHLTTEGKRWDNAVAGVRSLLTDPDPEIRELTERMFQATGQTRYHIFGAAVQQASKAPLNGYTGNHLYYTCDYLEFVASVVGHDILDDGDPAIHYYDPATDEPCTKNQTGALPYFYFNLECLRLHHPDAEVLTAARAIEAFDLYESRIQNRVQNARERIRQIGVPRNDLENFYLSLLREDIEAEVLAHGRHTGLLEALKASL